MKMSEESRTFWQVLEDVPNGMAVAADWRMRMGHEYEYARAFLRPTQELATSYPCIAPENCGCHHDVVRHDVDDIVAVCHCGRGCANFALKRSDLAVHRLDKAALGRALREAFGFSEEADASTALPGTTLVGSYAPYSGVRHPVYLTIRQERDEFDAIADALLAREVRPFILASPTRELCSDQTERRLTDRKAWFIPLSENLGIEAGSRFTLRRPVEDILVPYREKLYPPEPASTPLVFFPTPAGIGWAEITLKFLDGHTLTVKAGEVVRRVTFTDMGMENCKNRLPTKQWRLLEAFAEERGKLRWSSRGAKWGNKKQKQFLSAHLRDFFRLEDDPIVWDKDGKVYRCRFKLVPEGGDPD